MQALQGASLVGHNVVVAGNQLAVANGQGQGGFNLSTPADSVSVDVLSPAGQVLSTLQLGAQSSGMHSFDWTVPAGTDTTGLTFRATATTGGIKSTPTALMSTSVDAVSTSNNALQLELGNGQTVAYGDIKAFN
jgi:flagellar basal-body rod modification protein FlgD